MYAAVYRVRHRWDSTLTDMSYFFRATFGEEWVKKVFDATLRPAEGGTVAEYGLLSLIATRGDIDAKLRRTGRTEDLEVKEVARVLVPPPPS